MKKSTMKKLLIALMAMTMVFSFAACGSSGSEEPAAEDTTAAAEDTEMANPLEEVSKEDMIEGTGVDIDAPEGATDVKYFILTSESAPDTNGEGTDKVAQVMFKYNDKEFTYRAQQASIEPYDMCGIEGEAMETYEKVPVNYCEATVNIYDGAGGVFWIDLAPGIDYSLTCTNPIEKDELVKVANDTFVPTQGETE